MRLLHTSDWHLGQKFINQSRETEHEGALEWLLHTIREQSVDLLIVAGDVFDVSSPPVSAEEQYYRFLTRLRDTGCRHVVVIGGNHDSPSKLDAPRGLLRALDVHVVGSTTGELADELIELRGPDGELQALVAAVPFLRDKDFKFTISGETLDARHRRIQAGILQHYEELAGLVKKRLKGLKKKPPVIATGHLYAKGAQAAEEQANIYVGNLENIDAGQFPELFDYVALGHIHRPQALGKHKHIRYSGSPIPLSFSEVQERKIVVLADFEAGKGLTQLQELPIPVQRRLLSLRGAQAEVELKLQQAHDPEAPLPAWVEVTVESDYAVPGLDQHLRALTADMRLSILKLRNERRFDPVDGEETAEQLENLSPEEVFEKRCAGAGAEERDELLQTFRELRAWAAENADKIR